MVKSSSQKLIAMDTLSCIASRCCTEVCLMCALAARRVPLPWRAWRDTWERAAARAGGVAAEHGAGWATLLKTAQHETSTRYRITPLYSVKNASMAFKSIDAFCAKDRVAGEAG